MKPKDQLTAATFKIQNSELLKGWQDPSESWNGYPVPYFEIAEARKVIALLNNQWPQPAYEWVGTIIKATAAGIQEGYQNIRPNGDYLYDLSLGWCWSRATGHMEAKSLAERHRDVADALSSKEEHDRNLEKTKELLESCEMNAATADSVLEDALAALNGDTPDQRRYVFFKATTPEDRQRREAGELDDHWEIFESKEEAQTAYDESQSEENLHSSGIATINKGTDW